MNTAPLPHQDAGPPGRLSAAELAGDDLGRLLRGDRTHVELGFADACRYVGVSPRTVDDVWRTMAEHLAGPEGHRACLWSNGEIAARAGVSGSQARRALRILAAFDILDRQRRFNRSSVTSVNDDAARRAPPAAAHARCDEEGCEGCALGDVQTLLQAHFGAQVWMHGWAEELALGLKQIHSPTELAHEITSNMDDVPADERVKVARTRLQYLIGKRGRRHKSRNGLDSHASETARTGRAGTDVARGTPPHEFTADTRDSDRALLADRAATKTRPKQVTKPPPSESRVPAESLADMREAVVKGAQAAGVSFEVDQAERWAQLAVQHQLAVSDVQRGLFVGFESVERTAAVVRWRLTDPDGQAGIVSAAEQFRSRRRERAQKRLGRLRRHFEQKQADERAAAAKSEAARSRAEQDASLRLRLGEQPAVPIKALMCWLPAVEGDFAAGREVNGMLLRRLRDTLTSEDAVVARQARSLVPTGLVAQALSGACAPESTAVSDDFETGRLFALD